MIIISGIAADYTALANQYPSGSIERKIITLLSTSDAFYAYASRDALHFELVMRKNIIIAAMELYRSNFSFRTFRKSKCNEEYWKRTEEGGFLLKIGVKPSDAIRDIYKNSSKYGTECATAMVIVYYKALVEIFPEELFNELFPDIELANWHNLDSDLGIANYRGVPDYLPGDCRYIRNPDVDPLTPEWQGENVIDLGNGMYYGHGIGIGTIDYFIEALNRLRREGAEESAFLTDSATRPNFKSLANQYLFFTSGIQAGSYSTAWYAGV